jgi:hypothetical protein
MELCSWLSFTCLILPRSVHQASIQPLWRLQGSREQEADTKRVCLARVRISFLLIAKTTVNVLLQLGYEAMLAIDANCCLIVQGLAMS